MNESRDAYRMAYEEGIRWLASLDSMLERHRTRATEFLAAAIIAAGVGLSGLNSATPPSKWWLGLMIAGLTATLVAAIATTWGVKGQFRLDPRRLAIYGDDTETFPDNDAIYEEMALWLAQNSRLLYQRINRRRRWLYVSMIGAVAMLAGIVAIRVDVLYG